ELPVVALGVAEVHALAVRMVVGNARVLVARGREALAHGLDVVDLEAEVVQSGPALVRDPRLGGRAARLVQREVGVVVADVHPLAAVHGGAAAADPELRERGAQEAQRGLEVAGSEIGVIESDRHRMLLPSGWEQHASAPAIQSTDWSIHWQSAI